MSMGIYYKLIAKKKKKNHKQKKTPMRTETTITQITQLKMNKGLEQKYLQRRHSDGQQVYENMLKTINY